MLELCDLCRSIKLRPPALPLQPIKWNCFDRRGHQGHPAQFYDHYPSFERLRESANGSCPLRVLLLQSLLNGGILTDPNSFSWGGRIALAWYRTLIDLEYESNRRILRAGVDRITESCPGQWDKLDVLVQNPLSRPRQVLSAYPFAGEFWESRQPLSKLNYFR